MAVRLDKKYTLSDRMHAQQNILYGEVHHYYYHHHSSPPSAIVETLPPRTLFRCCAGIARGTDTSRFELNQHICAMRIWVEKRDVSVINSCSSVEFNAQATDVHIMIE